MTKLRKTVLMLGALLASSVAFVGCSDDDGKLPDDMLGATYIQAITAGCTNVDLHWTITPTENVEGYKIQIFTGTIGSMGSEVVSQTFDKKTYQAVFNGLQPDTKYVVASQCIPAAGSKFKTADVAYFEFWTAPVVNLTSVNVSNVKLVEPEEGDPYYTATIALTWDQNLSVQNCGGYTIAVYPGTTASHSGVVASGTASQGGTSATFNNVTVVPGESYCASIVTVPSNYCWFTSASVAEGQTWFDFLCPAVD